MADCLYQGKSINTNEWVKGFLTSMFNCTCILQVQNDITEDFCLDDIGAISGKVTPVIPETVSKYMGTSNTNIKI